MKVIKLNHDVKIPVIGIGTFTMSPQDAQRDLLNKKRWILPSFLVLPEGFEPSIIDPKSIVISTSLWEQVCRKINVFSIFLIAQ